MKKALSLLLAVLMLLSMLPGALAQGYGPDAPSSNCPPHSWSEDPGRNPTCTEPGDAIRFCTKCGKQERVTKPALGHNWGDRTNIVEPTCTKNGHYDVVCKRCGFKGTFRIDALGHEWGEWYVRIEATPGNPGVKRRDCIRLDTYELEYYTVDDEDLPDPDYSQTVSDFADGNVTIHLTEVSCPDNGWAYSVDVPETITYHFRITSTYPEPITIRWLLGLGYPEKISGQIDGVLEETYSIPANRFVTREDVLASAGVHGYGNTIVLHYKTADGKELQAKSNFVNAWVTCDDDTEQPALTVTETVINTPSRGYFLPGETVYFEGRLTNTGDKTITQLHWSDTQSHLGGNVYSALEPGDTYTIPAELSTVVGDATPGVTEWLETNVIIANGETADGDPVMGMGSVNYPCATGKTSFSLRKYETSVPLTAPYYVEGEEIHYGFELVNEGETTLSGAQLTDPLIGMYNVSIPDVAPGASWVSSLPLSYQVTAADVPGSVTNAAAVTLGNQTATAQVTSLTGEGELPESVVLTKQWIGPVPARGYYVEGDKVNFALILTNYSKTEIVGVLTITDVLDAGFVRSHTDLEAGKSVMDIFTYTVTDKDVEARQVTNWAYARYSDTDVIESNHVTVPCGKPGTILGGETWCERTLTGRGEGTDTYAQTYCAEHSGVKAQAAELPAAEAAALWREAVDTLYIRWIEQVALNDELCENARAERTTFLALCDILAENQTEAGAVALAKLLEDKCTDLCYVLNTPVTEPRKDVLSDAVDALTLPAPADGCTCTADAQDVTTASLCEKHATVPAQAAALLAQITDPGESVRYSAYIAEAYGYQTAVNRLNGPAAKALAAYIEAARATLSDFYGNGVLQVGELTARAAREVLLAICAGK